MSGWRTVWRRRRTQEAELDAELRFQIDRQVQDYVTAGLSLEEARRRVRLDFAATAAWLPARRAAAVTPVTALREN